MKLAEGKVKGTSKQEMHNNIHKIENKKEVFVDENPNHIVGEGYPHGVIWTDEKDKKSSTVMIIATGDNHYEMWRRIPPKRIPKTSTFIEWKHLIDFHDYELVDMGLACIERASDEEYIVYKRVRCDR